MSLATIGKTINAFDRVIFRDEGDQQLQSSFQQHERILRVLASEDRTSRRILANRLGGVVDRVSPGKIDYRLFRTRQPKQLLLPIPSLSLDCRQDVEEHREVRAGAMSLQTGDDADDSALTRGTGTYLPLGSVSLPTAALVQVSLEVCKYTQISARRVGGSRNQPYGRSAPSHGEGRPNWALLTGTPPC